MRNKLLRPYRERVVGAARGRVLEVGIGSGVNLPFYGTAATQIVGIDPSPGLLTRAHARMADAPTAVILVEGSAEDMPLESHSFDTVLTTWTACSIADPGAALAEMRRVLKPGGELLFVEHGRAPEKIIQRWQDRLTPLWRTVSGGCHLNRKIDDLLEEGGFEIRRMNSGYIRGPRIMTFLYEGTATSR